jgi:hypothetical protein
MSKKLVKKPSKRIPSIYQIFCSSYQIALWRKLDYGLPRQFGAVREHKVKITDRQEFI